MHADQKNQDLKAAIGEKLQPIVQQVIESFALAGMAVGIVKDGELVYARGFGARNVDTREPVTSRSLFHMASVSKPFVATAIMQLVEQGKMELDAPVIAYLPCLSGTLTRFAAAPVDCSEAPYMALRIEAQQGE